MYPKEKLLSEQPDIICENLAQRAVVVGILKENGFIQYCCSYDNENNLVVSVCSDLSFKTEKETSEEYPSLTFEEFIGETEEEKNKANTEIIDIHTKSTNEHFTLYGCGIFNETKKVLTKAEAALLYIELHKWLFTDKIAQ